MEKALELRNVSVVRDGRYILRSVDLDICKGENGTYTRTTTRTTQHP